MTVYKVVWLNDMGFVQEKNFDSQAPAVAFAATISGWKRVLQIVSSQTVTDITT